MGKREKILVGLMIVALLYGAFEVLVPAGDKNSRNSQETDISSSREMAEKISAEMDQAELSPEQARILQLAGQKWERNPFYRLPERQNESEPDISGNDKAESLQYTGYLEVGNVKMAIINGVEYKQGERLDQGGTVIENIFAEKVVLKSLDTGERITVPYKQ